MFNSLKIYHIKTDLLGNYTYVNNYFKKQFDKIHTSYIGQSVENSILPQDLEISRKAVENLLYGKSEIEGIELRKPDSDGGFFWTYWEFTVDFDLNKLPIGINCIGFDLTHSKIQQIVNQDLLNLLNKSQQISATATFMYNTKTKNLSCSNQIYTIFGLDKSTLNVYQSCLEKVHKDDLENALSGVEEILKSKNDVFRTFRIYDIAFPDGIKYLETVFSHYKNSFTKVDYIIGSILDISKLRKREHNLSNFINHLNSILDNDKKGIIVINRYFKIVSYNLTAINATEFLGGILQLGRYILDYIPEEFKEKLTNYYKRVFQGERISVPEEIHYPSGHFLSEIEYYPIFNNDNLVDFMVINCKINYPDSRSLLKNTTKLSLAESIINYQELEKDRIASDLHDSVNQILCATKVHLSNLPPSGAKKSSIELIDHALAEINQIVHNSSKFLIQNSSFQESLEEYLDLALSHTLIKHDLIYLSNSHEKTIEKVKLPLFRVIQEIIQNVIKHSNARLVRLKIKVRPSYIIIATSDNGKGFGYDTIKKGLGMENILNRIAYLSGEIKLISKVEKGTIYIIKIPIVNE